MRIAVVGTCASGKSTIVAELRARGVDAYIVSQEHSIVRDLWRHLNPDRLVLLDATFESVLERRGGSWPRWLYELQRERMRDACEHADLIVDTSVRTVEETVTEIISSVQR